MFVSRQTVINWKRGARYRTPRVSSAFPLRLASRWTRFWTNVRRSTCAKPRAIEEQSRSQSRSISSGC
ncbi:MAG: hypothetical protein ACLTSX_11945 [Collinsella sp.]